MFYGKTGRGKTHLAPPWACSPSSKAGA
nr:hypothetical protein [Bifidobacterium longum]